MTTPTRHHERVDPPVQARTPATIGRCRALPRRWRERTVARKRRVLVQWLRRTANRAHDTDPIRRRREALLHYRAAAVRSELLEIAAMLECTRYPDPAGMAALHKLLANGCDSPLYNADVHVSELRATLYSLRTRFATKTDTPDADTHLRQPGARTT
jgi:hypothetical protein